MSLFTRQQQKGYRLRLEIGKKTYRCRCFCISKHFPLYRFFAKKIPVAPIWFCLISFAIYWSLVVEVIFCCCCFLKFFCFLKREQRGALFFPPKQLVTRSSRTQRQNKCACLSRVSSLTLHWRKMSDWLKFNHVTSTSARHFHCKGTVSFRHFIATFS